jgi:hypothetical protein
VAGSSRWSLMAGVVSQSYPNPNAVGVAATPSAPDSIYAQEVPARRRFFSLVLQCRVAGAESAMRSSPIFVPSPLHVRAPWPPSESQRQRSENRRTVGCPIYPWRKREGIGKLSTETTEDTERGIGKIARPEVNGNRGRSFIVAPAKVRAGAANENTNTLSRDRKATLADRCQAAQRQGEEMTMVAQSIPSSDGFTSQVIHPTSFRRRHSSDLYTT